MRHALIAPTLLVLAAAIPASAVEVSPVWYVPSTDEVLIAPLTPATSTTTGPGFQASTLASKAYFDDGTTFTTFTPSSTNGLLITGLNPGDGTGTWAVDGVPIDLQSGEAYFLAMAVSDSSGTHYPVLQYVATDSDELASETPPTATVYLVDNISKTDPVSGNAYLTQSSEYHTYPSANYYRIPESVGDTSSVSLDSRTITFPLDPANDAPTVDGLYPVAVGGAVVAATSSNLKATTVYVSNGEGGDYASVLTPSPSEFDPGGMRVSDIIRLSGATDPDTDVASLGIRLGSEADGYDTGTWIRWRNVEGWESQFFPAESSTWDFSPNDYLQFVPNSWNSIRTALDDDSVTEHTATLSVTVIDDQDEPSASTFTIAAELSRNQEPIFSTTSIGANPSSGTLSITANDPDGDTYGISFELVTDSIASYTLNSYYYGTASVDYSEFPSGVHLDHLYIRAIDELGDSVTQDIEVYENHAPEFTDETSTFTFEVLSTDDTQTYEWEIFDEDVATGSFGDYLTLSLSQSGDLAERAGTQSIIESPADTQTLELSTGTVSVSFANPIAPDGYVSGPVEITFTPNSTASGSETFSVTFTDSLGMSTSRDITINQTTPSDMPFVGVVADGSLIEGDSENTGAFHVIRSVAGSDHIRVFYTVSGTAADGTDYVSLGNSVDILPEFYVSDLPVTVLDDQTVEGLEDIIVTIDSVSTVTTEVIVNPPQGLSGIQQAAVTEPLPETLTPADYTINGGPIPDVTELQMYASLGTIEGTASLTITDNDLPPTPPAVTPVVLTQDQVPVVQQVVSAPNETPKFFSFAAGSPDALASLKAAIAGKDNTQVRGFSWDAKNQVYVELPAEPEGGLTRDNAVFLVTRIDLGLVQGTTTYATPHTVTLKPGWNFIGVPVLTLGDGTVSSSHPWVNFNANGADISSAFQWTGAEYVVASNLVVGTGYWVKNRTTGDVALIRQDTAVAVKSVAGRGATTDTPPPPPSAGAATQADGGACGAGSGIGLLLGLGWLARLGFRSRQRRG